jgi:hypothetical protein
MNELLPIIRRKRRPLVRPVDVQPELRDETDRTDATNEARKDAGTSEGENEKESDADVSTEGEAN